MSPVGMVTDAIREVPYIADPVEVGRGGFATVYRATDLLAGRPVAVKLLAIHPDDVDLKYFDRERESLARLSNHPSVVTLHRTGVTTSGVPYLVMEYASGGSLADRLKADGPIPWADAVRWLLPICGALGYAHEQGIRHRDVKPQNILISDHGHPLLSDFGIAGPAGGAGTITNRTKLSLSYASPEQIDGRDVDDSTDVYSLGSTLYALIAGGPAFADIGDAGFLGTARRIVGERPPTLDPSVPLDIRDAISAAMAKNPANRPTIDAFRLALSQEIRLGPLPAGDELPPATGAMVPPAPARTGILASTGAGSIPAVAADRGETGQDAGWFAALRDRRAIRSLALAVVALLAVAGLGAAAWSGRDGGDAASARRESAPATGRLAGETQPTVPPGDDDPAAPARTTPSSTIEADRDDDGVADALDNCPDVGNRSQENVDGDVDGDACDADDDNDGVSDGRDNCPLDVSRDQGDVDGDGIGDACDDFPDQDGDGVIDTDDPCIEQPGDADTDGDGIPDKCDPSPRGMVAVAASVEIDRVTILNVAYGEGEADMFGDLTVDGNKFALPQIAGQRDIRPGNWLSDRVSIEASSPLVQVRIRIRDEDDCLFCRDGLVDITPDLGSEALHLLIDTRTGVVDLASESWNRLGSVGTLTGPAEGDLSGTINQVGEDDGVHRASIELSLTLVRQPAP